jgi:hypothetical protein
MDPLDALLAPGLLPDPSYLAAKLDARNARGAPLPCIKRCIEVNINKLKIGRDETVSSSLGIQ